ncbi:phage tail sheath subtilisin-like domain-containing protein, partial [Stutzerimonas nitrititolerans]|uniref:phage tail sheath subtilisin-like domain-containing protein n=1 Tax=Stutzerimonas nitrititolerans TaxID=2482751 RepID=UPI0028A624CF
LETGSAQPLVPVRVTRDGQGDELFGRGSMLAEQFRAIKSIDLYTETWAIPLADAELAQPAKGAIVVTASPAETRPLALYIAGYRVWCEMVAGAALPATAQAIAEAINADGRLPVIASIKEETPEQIDIECRWGGETGNSISLADCLKGEERTAGLGLTYTAPAGGAVNPDLLPAIAAMGNEWWNWICLPYTDTVSLEMIEGELAKRYGPMRQMGGRAFAAVRGSHSATATLGNGRNSPHLSIMGMGASPSAPWVWAATNAIVGAKSLAIDPSRPLQRLPLPGLIGPREDLRWDDAERNLLLFDGIATYTVATD